ncbi:MAG: nucleotide exchange factor GrpE [Patescibacteria group bacterium]
MKHDKKLEELRTQADEYLAGWKRAQADYQNLEKEYAKRMASIAEYAAADIIARFLPVIDNFELALSHMPKDVRGSEWARGLLQVQKERDETFAAMGIARILSDGAHFDPHLHEAVGYEPSDTVPDGHIIKEAQVGYKMEGRLIRPARVIVSKGKHH